MSFLAFLVFGPSSFLVGDLFLSLVRLGGTASPASSSEMGIVLSLVLARASLVLVSLNDLSARRRFVPEHVEFAVLDTACFFVLVALVSVLFG